jgi:hypothetical protein
MDYTSVSAGCVATIAAARVAPLPLSSPSESEPRSVEKANSYQF